MSQQGRSHGETATGIGIVAVLWVGALAMVIPSIVVKRVVDAIIP